MREDVAVLFLHPSVSEACTVEEVLSRLKRDSTKRIKYMTIPVNTLSSAGINRVVLQDVDQNFRSSKGKNAAHLVSSFVVSAVLEFLNLLEHDQLDNCMIPSLDKFVDSAPSVPETEPTNTDKMDIDETVDASHRTDHC